MAGGGASGLYALRPTPRHPAAAGQVTRRRQLRVAHVAAPLAGPEHPPAPPSPTRRSSGPKIACWASPCPRSRTGCGWATAHTCPMPKQDGGYLAFWLDRCSRQVGGGDVRATIPENLVSGAFRRALGGPCPSAGRIVYSATRFEELLTRYGPQQSRSRRGNCYDNAHVESFGSRFKTAAAFQDEPGPRSKSATASPTTMHRAAVPSHCAPNHFKIHLQTTSRYCIA